MAEPQEAPASPFTPMFQTFRAELDEHHDRRERVIKASRDITAASKKIIFSLQRIRKLNAPVPQHITKSNKQYYDIIEERYKAIAKDVQGLNAYRYRSITGGNQEFMEAVTFQYYLETQTLITYEEARKKLEALGGDDGPVMLTHEDYLLGIYDMTGELMRFAITNMATGGAVPSGAPKPTHSSKYNAADSDAMDVDLPLQKQQRNVLTDLRELKTQLESLNVPWDVGNWRDVGKKKNVMRQSVEKVEKALYGLVVRGAERPKGWVPDLRDESRNVEEVASY